VAVELVARGVAGAVVSVIEKGRCVRAGGLDRRLVGIDLGIASSHTVRVLAGDGRELARRRCEPTLASLSGIESAALAGAADETKLEVVIEPTGPAWLPVAVFFIARGHTVFRVSSAKSADLRRFLSRQAKSNGIDADTLARLPLVDPDGVVALQLPSREAAALDRRVRATDRLTRQAGRHKSRIRDLVRQLMPATPLNADLGQADLAVLQRWADPRALLDADVTDLTSVIKHASRGHQGAERTEQWRASARAALELYDNHPAVAFSDLAAELATEVRLLRAIEAELHHHAQAREEAYRWADPGQLARSLPGVAEVSAPTLVAMIGRADRFPTGARFRSFTGLTPRASETGNTDRKGQPMTKAGPARLRTTLVLAADTARKQDPQLAKIYYRQMVERGAGHTKALCVVAAGLAERLWAVLRRGMPYVICDTDGTPITTTEQAKQIIAERWTVPAEVRARGRSRKTTTTRKKEAGKAPHQVHNGRERPRATDGATRGDLPHSRSSTPASTTVKHTP
jgi:transposase